MVVGVLHGLTDRSKKIEPLGNGEPACVAIYVDLNPIDVIHHNVRYALFGAAAIQESDDIGMDQTSQRLALVTKAPKNFVAVRAGRYHLYSDTLPIFVVGALC